MAKNIVICCDGTGNDYGQNNTNVVKIYQLAQKSRKQAAYYAPGIGACGAHSHAAAKIRPLLKQCTGGGFWQKVEDAYQFLMQNYDEGDRVFLFGFSRGALAVRTLAALLQKCGLLHRDLRGMVPYACKIYRAADNLATVDEFKRAFCRPCAVHFIGEWDTVSALFGNAGCHAAALAPEAAHAYQALALDEIRRHFKPCFWPPRDNAQQVWFAGTHFNVGGGYCHCGLSNIALKWMAQKAQTHGMLLDEQALDNIKSDPLAPQHDSCSLRWRPLGKHLRRLPQDARVHASVRERLGKKVEFCDKNGAVNRTAPYAPQAATSNNTQMPTDRRIQWVE